MKKTYFRLKDFQYKPVGIVISIMIFAGLFMFSNLLLKKNNLHLPEDRFSFMPKEEQVAFISEVEKVFQEKNQQYFLDLQKGIIIDKDKIEYGLDTIAQLYHQAPQSEKKSLINYHFTTMLNAKTEEEIINKNLHNFEFIKKYLNIRIYSSDYLAQTGEDWLIFQEDLEDTVTVLVLDHPKTIRNITPQDAKNWNVSTKELFVIAKNNSFNKKEFEIETVSLKENINVKVVSSAQNIFVTSQLLNIENNKDLLGKYGAIISVPHRHTFVIYPIETIDTVKAIDPMIFVTARMYEEGPGSISPNIYFYQMGEFEKLPYKQNPDTKQLHFYPTEKFTELLNQLAEIDDQKR